MSRLDSDLDYRDWAEGPYAARIERTCKRCGETILVDRDSPYVLTVTCDRCHELMMQTQAGKADQGAA